MRTQNTPKQAQAGAAERRPMARTRRVSEVFGILEPRPMEPLALVPAGLWKTGWLPKPQSAAS